MIHERAQVNRNTNRTEVVEGHAHTHRNASDTLTRFMVQRENVGMEGLDAVGLFQKLC
jgi:hypothetical protein